VGSCGTMAADERRKKRLTACYPGISLDEAVRHHTYISSPVRFTSNHLGPLAREATRNSKISQASHIDSGSLAVAFGQLAQASSHQGEWLN
jgi:hypothetical protein